MSEKFRFVSEHRRHRLLRKPAGEQIMPNGVVAITTPEVVYEFENGALAVNDGQDVLNDGWNPQTEEWDAPQDAAAWIRTCADFGSKVYEVLPEAPDPSPLFVEIGRLEAAGDLDGLMALGQAEHDSWARPQVLEAAAGAVAIVESAAKPKAKA